MWVLVFKVVLNVFSSCVILLISFRLNIKHRENFFQKIKKVLDFGIVIKLLSSFYSHRIVISVCLLLVCESLKMASKLKSHFTHSRSLWERLSRFLRPYVGVLGNRWLVFYYLVLGKRVKEKAQSRDSKRTRYYYVIQLFSFSSLCGKVSPIFLFCLLIRCTAGALRFVCLKLKTHMVFIWFFFFITVSRTCNKNFCLF